MIITIIMIILIIILLILIILIIIIAIMIIIIIIIVILIIIIMIIIIIIVIIISQERQPTRHGGFEWGSNFNVLIKCSSLRKIIYIYFASTLFFDILFDAFSS